MKRKEKEINSEEMEPPGNWVESHDPATAGGVQKNQSSEMMVNKTPI
ncbi:MAG TPA: hypothetical protein VEK32_21485 [Thermodesulfobacteriota bacterium]|nr:hypothetical protein [Thermodesulfobacteriota bacterium]